MLTRADWAAIAGWASLLAACVLGGLVLGERWLGLAPLEAVTLSFLTLAFGKLWFTFNLRDPASGPFRNEVTRNPWVWGAIGLCVLLLLAAVYVPGLSTLLETRAPRPSGWAVVLGLSLLPWFVGQGAHALRGRAGGRSRRRQDGDLGDSRIPATPGGVENRGEGDHDPPGRGHDRRIDTRRR